MLFLDLNLHNPAQTKRTPWLLADIPWVICHCCCGMFSEDEQDPVAQFPGGRMVGRVAVVLLALLRGPHWVSQTQNCFCPTRDISKQMHSERMVMVLK